MAIVKLQPDAKTPGQLTGPETIEAPANSTFTSLVPESRINSLLKYAEGYPWTVNYYGQLLNKNNTIEHYDPSAPNLTQSFYKVINMVIQVDSPLSSSYDQATGVTTVSGSAIAPYKVTPNVGDVFVAQVDSGEDALFIVTSVARKTHRKDTLYEISYNLYSYLSSDPSFIKTLESRINETYYFNKDTDYFNRDVLIAPSVKEANDVIKSFLSDSKLYYFNTFVQAKTGTILIPGVDYTMYDPLLINFIGKTVESDYLLLNGFNRHIYVSKYIDQPSILDAILTRSMTPILIGNKTYNFLPSHMLPNKARLGTMIHTGVDYVLYPTDPKTNADVADTTIFSRSLYLQTMKTANNNTGDNPIIIKTTNNNEEFITNALPELFKNDYYIVTENFFKFLNKTTTYEDLSYVELLIAKFIKREAIARQDIATVVQSYQQWSLLHQLYLLPVLWVISHHYTS